MYKRLGWMNGAPLAPLTPLARIAPLAPQPHHLDPPLIIILFSYFPQNIPLVANKCMVYMRLTYNQSRTKY